MDGSVRGMAAAGVGVNLVSLGLQEVQEDIGHARSLAAGGPGPGPGSVMRPLPWRTGCSLQVVHERSEL
jgi:hypothetical protein